MASFKHTLSPTQLRALQAVAAGRVNHAEPDDWVVGFEDIDAVSPRVLAWLMRERLIAIAPSTAHFRRVGLTALGLAALREQAPPGPAR